MSFLPIAPHTPWLAPLAGFSDLCFRLLCREYGCALACTEMISAKGLLYGGSGTARLLHTVPEDRPLVVQLFGAEPGIMIKAVEQLLVRGMAFFDLNAGCPVKKVVKTGAGAALLKDSGKPALAVLKEMVKAAGPGRVGIKIRLGWDIDNCSYLDLARGAEDLGAAWITLHPRTARQGFAGQADWQALSELKHRVKIPVLASGDLFTAQDAYNCLQETGADGVMFARGALRNPAVFSELQVMLKGKATSSAAFAFQDSLAKRLAILVRHIELCREHAPDRRSFLKMRSVVPRYLRGFVRAKSLRCQVINCPDWDGLQEMIFFLAEQVLGSENKVADAENA